MCSTFILHHQPPEGNCDTLASLFESLILLLADANMSSDSAAKRQSYVPENQNEESILCGFITVSTTVNIKLDPLLM